MPFQTDHSSRYLQGVHKWIVTSKNLQKKDVWPNSGGDDHQAAHWRNPPGGIARDGRAACWDRRPQSLPHHGAAHGGLRCLHLLPRHLQADHPVRPLLPPGHLPWPHLPGERSVYGKALNQYHFFLLN